MVDYLFPTGVAGTEGRQPPAHALVIGYRAWQDVKVPAIIV